jgi:hypothetical protein
MRAAPFEKREKWREERNWKPLKQCFGGLFDFIKDVNGHDFNKINKSLGIHWSHLGQDC